jgi:hypothetical protein
MSVDIKSLMSEADWWERVGYIAAAFVLVGVIIESYELYLLIREGKLREKAVEFVGVMILVVGLAAEILAQVQSNNRTGLIISALNAQAAEAQLALEKLKAPRTLGPARQQAITAAAAPFKGQRYGAAISQAADDGIAFWESLYSALERAGWVYMPSTMGMGNPVAGIPIAAIPGVEIVFDLAKEQELAPAALALGNALHADGMVAAVNRTRQSNPNEAERNVLQIVIGARVPPP